MDFMACYLPATEESDPSKSGFATREEAWQYVLSRCCEDCRKEEAEGSSPCGCEWIVAETDKIEAAESVEGLFEAGGWIKVYEKPAEE